MKDIFDDIWSSFTVTNPQPKLSAKLARYIPYTELIKWLTEKYPDDFTLKAGDTKRGYRLYQDSHGLKIVIEDIE